MNINKDFLDILFRKQFMKFDCLEDEIMPRFTPGTQNWYMDFKRIRRNQMLWIQNSM